MLAGAAVGGLAMEAGATGVGEADGLAEVALLVKTNGLAVVALSPTVSLVLAGAEEIIFRKVLASLIQP